MRESQRRRRVYGMAVSFALMLCAALAGNTGRLEASSTGQKTRSLQTSSPQSSWMLAQATALPPMASLYEAAKKEGQVVLWGPSNPEHIAPVAEAFKKKFPGIDVVHFQIQPPEFTQRLVAESRAGKLPEADIFELGPREILVLSQRGLLQVHDDWAELFGLSPASIYGDGIGVVNHDLPHIVAVNTQLVSKNDYPQTWDDLLDPKWKGKIIVEQRMQNIGGLGLAKGEPWLEQFALGLKAQQPIYVRGGTTSFNQLVSGQASLSIGPYLFHILAAKKTGAPADLLPLSPMLVSPRLTSIHSNAKHPNAGKLFAGWYATPGAQKLLEQASSRASIAPDSGTQSAELLKAHGIELIIDNNKMAPERVNMEKRVQELMGVRR